MKFPYLDNCLFIICLLLHPLADCLRSNAIVIKIMSSATDAKFPTIPPGLRALIDQCQAIYPDQTNPLQVTTVLKYWLGGQDPLDYISMYSNKGDPERGIPPHWHYVSFGLSDLHGDGRVHVSEASNKEDPISGMGFELTFRYLRCLLCAVIMKILP